MVKYPHLDKERELELGVLIQKRKKAISRLEKNPNLQEKTVSSLKEDIRIGAEAVDELVKANLGLVYDRARIFKSKYPGAPDFEDLVQEGMTGLMTAIEKYDPTRENKFSTVAYYWIWQSIARGVNKTGRLVRLPENRIIDYTKMIAIEKRYEEDALTREELDSKIMEELDLSRKDLLNIRNAASFPVSLNKKVGSADDSSKELLDVIGEDNHTQASGDFVAQNAAFEILRDLMKDLKPLNQEVLTAHFNLSTIDGEMVSASMFRESRGLTSSVYRKLLTESLNEIKGELTKKDLSLSDFLE